MMAKLMKTLELHYPMIQFLIKVDTEVNVVKLDLIRYMQLCYFTSYMSDVHACSLCCSLSGSLQGFL